MAGGDEHNGTKDSLIEAAERLIAEFGVDAVSIRSINAEAGHNAAATHYHFGTKEALVAGVIERHRAPVVARRGALLDELEANGVTAHGLAHALVAPLREVQATEPWGDNYVRFLAALRRAGKPWSELGAKSFARQRVRFEALVDQLLPDVPAAVRLFRYQVMSENVLLTLADRARTERFFGRSVTAGDDAASALVDFLAGGLLAPHHQLESTQGAIP